MRNAFLLVVIVLVAACGKKDQATTPGADAALPAKVEPAAKSAEEPSLLPKGFPKLTTDFVGVYEMRLGARTVEATIRGAGDRQRIEFPPGPDLGAAGSAWRQVMLTEGEGDRMVIWPEGEGAPRDAIAITRQDIGRMAEAFGADATARANAVKSGADKIAGLECDKWTFGDSETPATACVTRDGVTLSLMNGADTVLLAKSIEKARQDPAQFAPPADYEVVDAGECMRVSAEMVAAMQSGKRPDIDLEKLAKCQTVAKKMGAMFGAK